MFVQGGAFAKGRWLSLSKPKRAKSKKFLNLPFARESGWACRSPIPLCGMRYAQTKTAYFTQEAAYFGRDYLFLSSDCPCLDRDCSCLSSNSPCLDGDCQCLDGDCLCLVRDHLCFVRDCPFFTGNCPCLGRDCSYLSRDCPYLVVQAKSSRPGKGLWVHRDMIRCSDDTRSQPHIR